jgi:hypothetical protein
MARCCYRVMLAMVLPIHAGDGISNEIKVVYMHIVEQIASPCWTHQHGRVAII